MPGAPGAMPPSTTAPGTTAPGTTAPGTTAPGTTAPGTTPGTTPGTEAAAPPSADTGTAPTGDTGAGAGEGAFGGAGTASSTGMLGRGDANNRFNLFDNMSAIPQTRVWFLYQNMQNFGTGFTFAPSNVATFSPTRTVDLYRVGAEIALGHQFSIAFQDQYIASPGANDSGDSWGDPEILFKWAFLLDEHRAVAATFGLQPQVSTSTGELHEEDTRFLPGMLAYQELDNLFLQAGMQFGFSSRNIATTFDWALSAGYWVYRADCSDGNHRFLTGIAPQLEIYGKHVMVGSQNVPFNTAGQGSLASLLSASTTTFREDRNVIDVTVGGRVQLLDHVVIPVGYSFPITGGDVRRSEFLTGLNFVF
jgi:hypothetical protein